MAPPIVFCPADRLTVRRAGVMFLAVCFGVAATLGGCRSTLAPAKAPSHDTLERRIIVGYQGWFRTPDDGANMGWAHYRSPSSPEFAPGHLSIDYWPDTSELPEPARVATPFTHADGTAAKVFSSHDARVVDLHFRWMQDYGIDGAFMQRFAEPIVFDDKASQSRLRATDNVLRYATAAAERHGRSLAVMYDLSGLPAGSIARVMQDWRHVLDDVGVRRSPAYQRHRGRPVVAVWGVGFDDGRAYTLDEIQTLVTFLKDDPVYGGNTVMLGIPTWWREQTADAVGDPGLHAVLQMADILSPWAPGRYSDIGGVQAHAERFWEQDREWCAARGIDYMPVVFPGFSWRNLKGATGGISRDDGRFLWAQYRELANRGVTMVYQAMFDEMDEGTQIFKTSAQPPSGAFFESYAPLPSDHYLWLVGAAGKLLRRGVAIPERIVDRGGAPSINRYLHDHEEKSYAGVPMSLDTHRRFFQIADALRDQGGDSATLNEGAARIRVTGRWFPRHLWSNDPKATVTWEIGVPASGDYRVAVRYPGDPNQDHAKAARLRIRQAGQVVADLRLNLRVDALRWVTLGNFRLDAGTPCEVVMDDEPSTGAMVLFEPSLSLPKL